MEVHALRLGEGQGLSHKSSQPLADGVVEALDVSGETAVLANRLMLRFRNHGLISIPEIAEHDALPVKLGDVAPLGVLGVKSVSLRGGVVRAFFEP
jgi:hypothetical protein